MKSATDDSKKAPKQANASDVVFDDFRATLTPFGKPEQLLRLTDNRTGALFCECHIKASKLVELATTDAPLDPDEPDYRANREIVTNAPAFQRMKADAAARRSFSNIVAEYSKEVDPQHPLKIIGGQHRIVAIKEAHKSGVDEYHGVKVYFSLSMDQRLDVQLISNTSIGISQDLFDRMQETFAGPKLREWCQAVGLLEAESDFADRRVRGGLNRPGLIGGSNA